MRANLVRMIDLSTAAGAQVLLLGMRIPPNYGPDYTEQFRLCYTDVSRDKKLPLVPFLLNGIALTPNLMQTDGITPMNSGSPYCWQYLAIVEAAVAPLTARAVAPLAARLLRRQPFGDAAVVRTSPGVVVRLE